MATAVEQVPTSMDPLKDLTPVRAVAPELSPKAAVVAAMLREPSFAKEGLKLFRGLGGFVQKDLIADVTALLSVHPEEAWLGLQEISYHYDEFLDSAAVIEAASQAIEKFGTPVEPIMDVLSDLPHAAPEGVPIILSLFRKSLERNERKDWAVALRALTILAKAVDSKLVPVLFADAIPLAISVIEKQISNDEEAPLAAKFLGSLGKHASAALPALKAYLHYGAEAAAEALAGIGGTEATKILLGHRDIQKTAKALGTLASFAEPGEARKIVRILWDALDNAINDCDLWVAEAITDGLGRAGFPAHVTVKTLKALPSALQPKGNSAVARIGTATMAQAVKTAKGLESPEREVRRAALIELGRLQGIFESTES